MAQPTHTFSITAPGFMGLNTQDSPVEMDTKFALEANNCIIDRSGRISSRKGWLPDNTTNADLGTANIESIGELVDPAGVRTQIAAGNGKIFKKSGSTLTTLTYGGGGVAPTITANDWQMCGLNYGLLLFQQGHDPLIYDTALSTTTFIRVSEHPTYTGALGKNNCGIAAYGRVWSARSDTDKNTVQWCDTLSHQKWSGGTAGSLNLHGVWPQGGDEIVALAAHNNQLIIFGKRQVLIYTGAKDPSTMVLYDAIGNSGCAGRDTVQNTPHDLLYVSYAGLQSLSRTIQERSAPINTASRTVNDEIKNFISLTTNSKSIKTTYSQVDSMFLISFLEYSAVYYFDTRNQMPDGSYRASIWQSIAPQCFCYSIDQILYIGKPGCVAKYTGYVDNTSPYRMTYYTPWVDFGDPIRTSLLKRVVLSIAGKTTENIVFKWGFDYVTAVSSGTKSGSITSLVAEYNISEFSLSEYSQGGYVKSVSIPTSGSGKVVQLGIECQVTGFPISIQRLDVFTKDGAYK